MLDILKKKMNATLAKPTATCEWIKIEPVLGDKSKAETIEELTSMETLLAIFEFRANLLIQRTGLELSGKLLGGSKMHPFDAWNSV